MALPVMAISSRAVRPRRPGKVVCVVMSRVLVCVDALEWRWRMVVAMSAKTERL